MPVPSPVYGLMVPFLCVVTLPLAIFAGITTTLAFSVLLFRVMLVYVDIAVSLVPQYLMGRSGSSQLQSHAMTYASNPSHNQLEGAEHSTKSLLGPSSESTGPASGRSSPPQLPPLSIGYITSGHRSPTRTTPHAHAHFASAPGSVMSPSAGRRSRRGSLGGISIANSAGTITPVREETTTSTTADGANTWLPGGQGSSSFVMLKDQSASSSIVRDFEGVGGWRLASDDRATGDDDSDWANINSRLELPLDRTRQQHGRHHYRTPSGHSGPVTPGEGSWLMMKGGARGRASGEGLAISTDMADHRDRDVVSWAPAATSSSARSSVSPNSSRVRIGQGSVTFTGLERHDSYFPPTTSPKSARKATL